MKKITIASLGLIALALPAASFAAGINLYNGGLGQVAANPANFGVAVCNGGSGTLTQSVPVALSANGQQATVSSASSIAPGSCAYAYVPYSQFGMQAGMSYTVSATIDPNHTVITNSNNQTSYSVTVPGAPVAAQANGSVNGTADQSAQSGNWFTGFWHWLTGWL